MTVRCRPACGVHAVSPATAARRVRLPVNCGESLVRGQSSAAARCSVTSESIASARPTGHFHSECLECADHQPVPSRQSRREGRGAVTAEQSSALFTVLTAAVVLLVRPCDCDAYCHMEYQLATCMSADPSVGVIASNSYGDRYSCASRRST